MSSYIFNFKPIRKYIKHIAFFAFGYLILNILAYQIVTKPALNSYFFITNKTQAKHRKFLFADSHGAAVKQEDLDQIGISNFSFNGDNYIDMYFKIKYIIGLNIPVDTIIITVDDHTLSKYRERFNNLSRSIYYSTREDYFKYSNDQSPIAYYFNKHRSALLPLANTNNSFLFYSYIRSKFVSTKNWILSVEKSTTSWRENKNKVSACIKRFNYQYPNAEKSELSANCLKDIILLCRKNNIHIIGIKFPLSGDYLRTLQKTSFHADEIFLQEGIEVVDLKHDFSDFDEYFKDQDHLNKLGSKKFAIQLQKKILGLTTIQYPTDIEE